MDLDTRTPVSCRLLNEDLLTLAEAAALLPHRPHVSVFSRWENPGVKGARLPLVRIGGRRFVSRAALERFIAETTAAAGAGRRSGGSQLCRPKEGKSAAIRANSFEIEKELDQIFGKRRNG